MIQKIFIIFICFEKSFVCLSPILFFILSTNDIIVREHLLDGLRSFCLTKMQIFFQQNGHALKPL
jgi:hypothetical protein